MLAGVKDTVGGDDEVLELVLLSVGKGVDDVEGVEEIVALEVDDGEVEPDTGADAVELAVAARLMLSVTLTVSVGEAIADAVEEAVAVPEAVPVPLPSPPPAVADIVEEALAVVVDEGVTVTAMVALPAPPPLGEDVELGLSSTPDAVAGGEAVGVAEADVQIVGVPSADADAGAVVVAVTDSDKLFVVETLTVIVTEGGGEGVDVALAVALADAAASVGLSWPLLVVEGEAGVLADAAPPMLAVELAEASAVTVEHGVEDCETSPTLAEAVGDAESRDEVVGDIETVIVTEAPTLPLRDTPLVALLLMEKLAVPVSVGVSDTEKVGEFVLLLLSVPEAVADADSDAADEPLGVGEAASLGEVLELSDHEGDTPALKLGLPDTLTVPLPASVAVMLIVGDAVAVAEPVATALAVAAADAVAVPVADIDSEPLGHADADGEPDTDARARLGDPMALAVAEALRVGLAESVAVPPRPGEGVVEGDSEEDVDADAAAPVAVTGGEALREWLARAEPVGEAVSVGESEPLSEGVGEDRMLHDVEGDTAAARDAVPTTDKVGVAVPPPPTVSVGLGDGELLAVPPADCVPVTLPEPACEVLPEAVGDSAADGVSAGEGEGDCVPLSVPVTVSTGVPVPGADAEDDALVVVVDVCEVDSDGVAEKVSPKPLLRSPEGLVEGLAPLRLGEAVLEGETVAPATVPDTHAEPVGDGDTGADGVALADTTAEPVPVLEMLTVGEPVAVTEGPVGATEAESSGVDESDALAVADAVAPMPAPSKPGPMLGDADTEGLTGALGVADPEEVPLSCSSIEGEAADVALALAQPELVSELKAEAEAVDVSLL